MDPWNYIAPKSGNIINTIINSDEYNEKYFEIDHEGVSCQIQQKQTKAKSGAASNEVQIKQEVMSPVPQEIIYDIRNEDSPPKIVVIKTEKVAVEDEEFSRKQRRRRSMSVSAVMETTDVISHMTQMAHGIQKIHLSSMHDNNRGKGRNIHDMSSKSVRSNMSSASSHTNLTSATKYVSMAEAIYRLQKDTPERFHSYSKNKDFRHFNIANKNSQVKGLCIPQSPALMSKARNRNVQILSQKDIEDMEYEELQHYIKTHPIKANPIPKAVICGNSNLPNVERKAPTKPVPFKLTQIRKKPPQPERKVIFTAKPAPKHILEKPVELPKKTIHVTVPKSPKFMSKLKSQSLEHVPHQRLETNTQHNNFKRGKNPLQVSMDGGLPDQGDVGHSGVPLAQKNVSHPCKPKPFSFEERDKEILRKKVEKIQMVLEEERKMREFHANPIPNKLKKTRGVSPKSKVFEKKVEVKKENKENCDEQHKVFKARPPVVLFKSPFVPTKKERPVLEPCQKQLTTEIRAQKRNMFDQLVKEKADQLEHLRKLEDEERQRREEEEKAALRAQLVHKAAPVRHYQPVVIHPSDIPLTRPESPKFHSTKF